MRIVAGQYRGRKLIVPKGRDIRPTSDKIRGAVMNMLRARNAVEGAFVLDAFCGTGALGLEALSQGAAHCVFMDSAPDSLALSKENAKEFGVMQAVFFLKDSSKIGIRPENINPATLIFLDTPYGKDLIVPTLTALQGGGWIDKGAWIVCEMEKNHAPGWPDFINIKNEKIYGDTKINLLSFAGTLTP